MACITSQPETVSTAISSTSLPSASQPTMSHLGGSWGLSRMMVERPCQMAGSFNYEMAQSIQRILSGGKVEEHDKILFRHELLEAQYMSRGIDQDEAHELANKTYNYQEKLNEWIDGTEGLHGQVQDRQK